MKLLFTSENLYAKIRYNQNHNETKYRWRLFIKEGDKDEIMLLCVNVITYVSGYTYEEIIDGHSHYSVVYPASKILIDEDGIAWIK